jgi:hypothetical protein
MGEVSMFRHERHRRLLELLASFDAGLLSRCSFLFGGGARIVLQLGEYRESHGLCFLCSDPEGYAELRFQAASRGYDALFVPEARPALHLPGEPRIDMHGIRFAVEMEGSAIGVELVREPRIELDPGVRPDWSPVDCLSLADCYAEKLLANSDRWADREALSRDLIDLSALRRRTGPVPDTAWEKAEQAYKTSVRNDLLKAVAAFLGDVPHQQRCAEGLQLAEPAEILAAASQLLLDLEAPSGLS